ncbi:protein-tyrosine sulfotransferase-like [Choristoneura fumiferana]|uniref:protein-tyrosine sulfotransferase-like n=1 Tax=Choristoneura fumiferana TaxID=7141 RepID=UPI003D154E4D
MSCRQVTITGFDLSSYRQCMSKWNHAVEVMYQQCKALGAARCLPVRYEALVLRPRETLTAVLAFLQLPWTDAVLHHERYINQPHGVALSDVERSSDQVVRPVNLDALDKWVGALPADVRADMAELAPMLSVLGYDPWANPPRYAEPEPGRAPPPPRRRSPAPRPTL